jgi:hypothetical protein
VHPYNAGTESEEYGILGDTSKPFCGAERFYIDNLVVLVCQKPACVSFMKPF